MSLAAVSCATWGTCAFPRKVFGRHVVVPLHADIAVNCRKIGFDNLNPIIWHKIANANYEVENGSKFLGKPYEPNAIIKNDIEFILMQRKPGGYRKPTEEQRRLSMIAKKEYEEWFQQFWMLTGASTKHHPAPFPLELAYRLVRMFSFGGTRCLTPSWVRGPPCSPQRRPTETASASTSTRNIAGWPSGASTLKAPASSPPSESPTKRSPSKRVFPSCTKKPPSTESAAKRTPEFFPLAASFASGWAGRDEPMAAPQGGKAIGGLCAGKGRRSLRPRRKWPQGLRRQAKHGQLTITFQVMFTRRAEAGSLRDTYDKAPYRAETQSA